MSYKSYLWRLNNPKQRSISRKREKVRRKLRDRGFLPPIGAPMTIEQQEAYDQIGRDDYSFWNIVKLGKLNDGGTGHIRAVRKSVEDQILYRAKFNAKNRNCDFNLTYDDIFVPKLCPYLNIPIETDFLKNNKDNYCSIDRIDNSKGYVKGNVQVISTLANTMKNKATKEQLITFSVNVLKMYSSQNS